MKSVWKAPATASRTAILRGAYSGVVGHCTALPIFMACPVPMPHPLGVSCLPSPSLAESALLDAARPAPAPLPPAPPTWP